MNAFSITVAFLMGLTGSLHCAGMCGPIIWIMPFHRFNGVRKWAGIGLYHAGRISIYALAAFILYSFRSFFRAEWQQSVSITLGILLLIAGTWSFVWPGAQRFPWSGFIRTRMGYFFNAPSLAAVFAAGMLNGMLPCGLVYMALSATMTASSAVAAMLLMYVFGLGTMPVLVMISVIRRKSGALFSVRLRKMVPVALFLFGSLFVIRGMNLGIPYLSPQITVTNGTVRSSCCRHH